MNSAPEYQSEAPEMMESHQGLTQTLQQAIALHAGHMDGSEPTSPESQTALMSLLESALEMAGSMGMPS